MVFYVSTIGEIKISNLIDIAMKWTGHRAQGSGRRAQGSGRRAQGSGRRAQGSGRRAQGSGLRAQSSGRRAQGAKQLAPPTLAGESRPLRREGTQSLSLTVSQSLSL